MRRRARRGGGPAITQLIRAVIHRAVLHRVQPVVRRHVPPVAPRRVVAEHRLAVAHPAVAQAATVRPGPVVLLWSQQQIPLACSSTVCGRKG